MKTQLQIFYEVHRKRAEANLLFLKLVEDGLTRHELKSLIKLRPELWKRWENWLDKLPE